MLFGLPDNKLTDIGGPPADVHPASARRPWIAQNQQTGKGRHIK
jgi:hypothetical protein